MEKRLNQHWIGKDNHICKYCGQNLLSPYTTSECPKKHKPKDTKQASPASENKGTNK